jgi:pimeloyl-ACP methyl ester carboxylesterase
LKGQILEVNGIRLNMFIEGNGPDVILLHGFPDSALVWRHQIPALVQAGYRVIVPDLRGSGESEAPTGKAGYKLDVLVKDVICLMDCLGIEKAKLVGHDWGAILGWFVAIEHPERIDRYVAMSVGHPVSYRKGGFDQKVRSWYALAFQIPVLPEVITKSFRWAFMRLLTRNHPEISNWIEDKGRPGRLTAGINWYRANMMRMLFGRTDHVKVPVLGIWSDGDYFLTENQMKMSSLYVDAPWRYERIENATHWVQVDVPERLNRMLIDYFSHPLKY